MTAKRCLLFGVAALIVPLVVLMGIWADDRSSIAPSATDLVEDVVRASDQVRSPNSSDVPIVPASSSEPSVSITATAGDESCESIAIPGGSGFLDFGGRPCGWIPTKFAEFAEEQADLSWAFSMEELIRARVASRESLGFTGSDVECRATSCGMVFYWPEGIGPLDPNARSLNLTANEIATVLQEELKFRGKGGFHGYVMADGTRVTIIFLSAAEGRELFSPPQSAGTLRTIQALPSVPGIEVLLVNPNTPIGQHPSRRLAAEPDDSLWARGLETEIISQFSSLVSIPVSQLHVECRTSMCGLVFLTSQEPDSSAFDAFNENLENQLGLQSNGIGLNLLAGGAFATAMYFRSPHRSTDAN